MPNIFSYRQYRVYFWSNENEPLEPVHVHIGESVTSNATKVWILSDGGVLLEHNKSHIPEKDLNIILRTIERYAGSIVHKWEEHFNSKAVYKK